MTAIDMVKKVFGEIEDGLADAILFGCTGFPSFWRTNNIAKEMYYQLSHAKRSLARGFSIDDVYCGKDRL